MAVKKYETWARVFSFSKSARCYSGGSRFWEVGGGGGGGGGGPGGCCRLQARYKKRGAGGGGGGGGCVSSRIGGPGIQCCR